MLKRQYLPNGGSKILRSGAARNWLNYDGTSDGANTVVEANAGSNSSAFKSIRLCPLSATSFAVLYQLASTAGAVKLAICTIGADGTVTVGTPVTVLAATPTVGNICISKLSATKVIVGYAEGTNGQIAKTYTISGTTPTLDASLTVNASGADTAFFTIEAFSATRAACCYYNGTARKVIGLTIGSGTLTKDGSDAAITSAGNTRPEMRAYSSTKVVLLYSSVSGTLNLVEVTDGAPVVVGTPSSAIVTGLTNIQILSLALNSAGSLGVINGGASTSSQYIQTAFSLSGGTFTVLAITAGSGVPFMGHGAACMQTAGSDHYFLLSQQNQLNTVATPKVRVQALKYADIKKPIFGGAVDDLNGVHQEGCNDIARLSDLLAVAAYQHTSNYFNVKLIRQ